MKKELRYAVCLLLTWSIMMIGKITKCFSKMLQKCLIMCYTILLITLLIPLVVLNILLLWSGALALVLLAGTLYCSEIISHGSQQWLPVSTKKYSRLFAVVWIQQINTWLKSVVHAPTGKKPE